MVNTQQRMNGFEASVLDAKSKMRTRDGQHYICLNHGQKYRIAVRNDRGTRASVEIRIDGATVGKWVLGPHSRATIERPVDVPKKFTFYREDSGEAKSIGVEQGASENGLVECVFIAEHEQIQPLRRPTRYRGIWDHDIDDYWDEEVTGLNHTYRSAQCRESSGFGCAAPTRSARKQRVAAGATGLHGHSHQTFGTTHAVDKNMDTLTTICFRLVVQLPSMNHFIRAPARPITTPRVIEAPPRPPQERVPLVDEALVQDLVDMGFADRRLNKRLLFLNEGDVKKCVKELVRMEREADAPGAFRWVEELKTMTTELGFDQEEEACKAALIKHNGDIKQAIREAMNQIRAN